ncbi:hypothetical protein HRbin02_01256 [Candidatus Calditenuaceae archaeon HR02]|nr:hypothetical protein HRbin02_01256 [Candidatus Calditenuaceae archaeon HR02]
MFLEDFYRAPGALSTISVHERLEHCSLLVYDVLVEIWLEAVEFFRCLRVFLLV